MSNIESSIVSVLGNSNIPMTATAIAKALGFSKARSVDTAIDQLLTSNTIKCDTAGRYDVYSLVKTATPVQATSAAPVVESVDANAPATEGVEKKTAFGYSSMIQNGKNVITTPTGVNIEVADDQCLMVINGEPKYKVKTAYDVFAAIQKYTRAAGIATFTVTDMYTNKQISSEGDIIIPANKILFFNVTKVNVAA